MEKDKALEAAVAQIERAFGKGSIMRLGQQDNATMWLTNTVISSSGAAPKIRLILRR